MDYEILFIDYMNEDLLEKSTMKPGKICKSMLKKIIKLTFIMFKERKISNFMIEELEEDLLLIENDLVNNEKPYYILQSTCNRPPKGYHLLVFQYKEKCNKIDLYFNLLNNLKKEIISFYKTNKKNSLEDILVLQTLLKIIEYSYQTDIVKYNEQINYIMEILKKDEIPSITQIDNIYELINFVKEKLNPMDSFTLK